MCAAGWTAAHLYKGATDRDRQSAQNKLTAFLKAVFEKVRLLKDAKLFSRSLNESVQLPENMQGSTEADLSLVLIQTRIRTGEHYKCKEALRADIIRMVGIK